jgi:hypothetical protein
MRPALDLPTLARIRGKAQAGAAPSERSTSASLLAAGQLTPSRSAMAASAAGRQPAGRGRGLVLVVRRSSDGDECGRCFGQEEWPRMADGWLADCSGSSGLAIRWNERKAGRRGDRQRRGRRVVVTR